MEEGGVVGKLEHFPRSEPLRGVSFFGRQPDSYMSSILKSILKKLVIMNAPTKNLTFFSKMDIFYISYVLR